MSFPESKLVRQRSEPIPENPRSSKATIPEDVESSSLDGDRINMTFRVINQNDDHFKRSFKSTFTVGDVRRKLCKLLKIRADNLFVLKDDAPLADDVRISSLGDEEVDVLTKDDTFVDVDIVEEKFNESISVVVQNEPIKNAIPINITCKFHVVNQDHTFAKSFSTSISVSYVKESLAGVLGTEKDLLLLVKNGTILNDDVILSQLDIDNFGNLEMELFTKDGSKMKVDTVYKDVPISDILTVAIDVGLNKFINVNVEVIDARIDKPYLGGYRNKITGFEYHHAFTQTQDFRPKLPAEMKNTRDTQTTRVQERAISTGTNRGTQMRTFYNRQYIPEVTDVILTAKPYVPYSPPKMKYLPEEAARVIQKSWKAYRCRKYVGKWLIECRQRIQAARTEEMEELRIRDIQIQKEIRAKTFPKTKEDFDQLYAMVDRWKNTEIARISKLHTKGPKVAEFCLLLDKEVQLLRSVEKFRIELSEDYKCAKERALLNELSKPVTWRNAKGALITVDTVEAQQARKFKELYDKFCDNTLNTDERMELLVGTRYTLKNYKSPVTEQLVTLMERECELLVRNVPEDTLATLRKRIRSTLFQFVKRADFNGSLVAKHRLKNSKAMDDERLFACRQCATVKMYTEFPLDSRNVEVSKACNSCLKYLNADWVDMTPYAFILRAVRREERKSGGCSSLAFIIGERDIYFLVNNVWHSRSAVSEADNLIDLRLCRWRVADDWSPWNCVLLTFGEMKAHLKLDDPESAYGAELVGKVRNRHLLARMHFARLARVE